jgi:hypothetical protein
MADQEFVPINEFRIVAATFLETLQSLTEITIALTLVLGHQSLQMKESIAQQIHLASQTPDALRARAKIVELRSGQGSIEHIFAALKGPLQ